jgi:phosphate transport system substrate-binding protein
MKNKIALIALASLTLAGCDNHTADGGSASRDYIRIVGSSTVFPFAKAVSENFVCS